jgi:hypothetical protein
VGLQGGTLAVNSHAKLEVGTAGTAAASVITVDAGATVIGFGVLTGGAVKDAGVVEALGGQLAVQGKLSGGGTASIAAASTLNVTGALSTKVAFLTGSQETLALGAAGQMTGTISGFFAGGGTIDLLGLAATSITPSNGGLVLTVSGTAGSLATLHFVGAYPSGHAFHYGTDTHDGTNITFT